jgi:hypothetical protein
MAGKVSSAPVTLSCQRKLSSQFSCSPRRLVAPKLHEGGSKAETGEDFVQNGRQTCRASLSRRLAASKQCGDGSNAKTEAKQRRKSVKFGGGFKSHLSTIASATVDLLAPISYLRSQAGENCHNSKALSLAFGLAYRNSNSELRFPCLRLSTLPQLLFGLEPMFLVMALFLSPRHPNLVGLCPDCLPRWGCFSHL